MTEKIFPENATLAKKVSERKKRLVRLVALVIKAVTAHGKTTSHEEHSSHTKTAQELSIGGYQFLVRGSLTSMGGESVEIIHHEKGRVFYVYWSIDVEDGDVNAWAEPDKWYAKVIEILSNQKRIVRELKSQEARTTASELRRNREINRPTAISLQRELLVDRAKRLGISA